MREFYFDEPAADRAATFFSDHLRHFEGPHAGKPFILEPWQRKIVRDVYGWKRCSDRSRRYRTVYIEVPRKNGKTTLAAGLAIYQLLCDGEEAPQVYSAAGDRAQARICFDAAKKMIEMNPDLTRQARVLQHKVEGVRRGGFYVALSAEAYSKHGFNASAIIFDELHVQKTRDLWDVLATSTGARKQPLTIAITTAGHDRSSICWQMHQRAEAVIANPDADPSFYGVIYGAQPEEDWTDPAVWKKANPCLGKSLRIEYLKDASQDAQTSPDKENTFRNLHLNQWTEQAVRWLSMAAWDKCKATIDLDHLRGLPCWAGLDLATTRDITAFVLVFREDSPEEGQESTFWVVPYFWAPKENATDRDRQDKTTYMNWARNGFVELTDGNVTDYQVVEQRVVEICQEFSVQQVAYDPWNATQMALRLRDEHGIDVVEFKQSLANFTEPTKQFERAVVGGNLKHGNHPVLRWMASNIVVYRDTSNNIRPDKGKSSEKIDGIVALIMAKALADEGLAAAGSFYEDNELESI